MSDKPHSACVLGAGIIGSWTALHLAEAGVETVLLEQFPLPHTRGSSHGASRAFRFLGEETMDRLDYSLERWRSLEPFRQERLFLRTGLLNFGTGGDPWLVVSSTARRPGACSLRSPWVTSPRCPRATSSASTP